MMQLINQSNLVGVWHHNVFNLGTAERAGSSTQKNFPITKILIYEYILCRDRSVNRDKYLTGQLSAAGLYSQKGVRMTKTT